MVTLRRRVLIRECLAFLLIAPSWAGEFLDFYHLSDTHVSHLAGVDARIVATLAQKRDANQHLSAALDRFARDPAPPAFVVITGDMVEGYSLAAAKGGMVGSQIETFQKLIDGSRVPVYPTLGNHDLTQYQAGSEKASGDQSGAASARRTWMRVVPRFREGTYYAFTQSAGRVTYRFLMLDDGEAEGLDAPFAQAQAAWAKQQAASHPNEKIVLAMHIPLATAPYSKTLRDALAGAGNIMLILAGHRHADGFEEIEIGSRIVPQVRTAALFLSEHNCRRVRLYEDRIEVSATGRPDAIQWKFPVR